MVKRIYPIAYVNLSIVFFTCKHIQSTQEEIASNVSATSLSVKSYKEFKYSLQQEHKRAADGDIAHTNENVNTVNKTGTDFGVKRVPWFIRLYAGISGLMSLKLDETDADLILSVSGCFVVLVIVLSSEDITFSYTQKQCIGTNEWPLSVNCMGRVIECDA